MNAAVSFKLFFLATYHTEIMLNSIWEIRTDPYMFCTKALIYIAGHFFDHLKGFLSKMAQI